MGAIIIDAGHSFYPLYDQLFGNNDATAMSINVWNCMDIYPTIVADV